MCFTTKRVGDILFRFLPRIYKNNIYICISSNLKKYVTMSPNSENTAQLSHKNR